MSYGDFPPPYGSAIVQTPVSDYAREFKADRDYFADHGGAKRTFLIRGATEREFPQFVRGHGIPLLWVSVSRLTLALHVAVPVWFGLPFFEFTATGSHLYADTANNEEVAGTLDAFADRGMYDKALWARFASQGWDAL